MNYFQGLKQIGFISEILIISIGLSYLIKYGGSYLSIFATPDNALPIVLAPTLCLAIALGVRYALTTVQRRQNS